MTSQVPLSGRLARLGLAGLIALAACSGSDSSSVNGALCTKPLQGKRYSVCGHLSAAPAPAATPSGLRIQGSLDAVTPSGAAGGHELSGGTFHADH
jgi:hypothetical protein